MKRQPRLVVTALLLVFVLVVSGGLAFADTSLISGTELFTVSGSSTPWTVRSDNADPETDYHFLLAMNSDRLEGVEYYDPDPYVFELDGIDFPGADLFAQGPQVWIAGTIPAGGVTQTDGNSVLEIGLIDTNAVFDWTDMMNCGMYNNSVFSLGGTGHATIGDHNYSTTAVGTFDLTKALDYEILIDNSPRTISMRIREAGGTWSSVASQAWGKDNWTAEMEVQYPDHPEYAQYYAAKGWERMSEFAVIAQIYDAYSSGTHITSFGDFQVGVTPEPGTLALLGLGLPLGLAWFKRRRAAR